MSGEGGGGEEGRTRLMDLVRTELVNIPVANWGFFFPCHVAVWRYIERMRPGVFGELKAYFKGEPSFEGKGASWFCEDLGSNEDYISALEAIMYPITSSASSALRQVVTQRGFFRDEEIPPIDAAVVDRLASMVLGAVDRAVSAGQIR